MHIERIQIEEGFLDGLDLRFNAGLNVVIGARGTGKTSLIELVRFCLDVPNHLPDTSRRSRDHALSILGSGQVTITLLDGEQRILVSRTANDKAPQVGGQFVKPIIFSQTEVETIGLEPKGRLRLIDSFLPGRQKEALDEEQAVVRATSLSAEIRQLSKEIDEINQQLSQKPALDAELIANAQLENGVSNTSVELQKKTAALHEVSKIYSDLAATLTNTQRVKQDILGWHNTVKRSGELNIDQIDAGRVLARFSPKLGEVKKSLDLAANYLAEIWHELDAEEKAQESQKLNIEAQSRIMRQEIEAMQAGAGQILRRAQDLRAKSAHLSTFLELHRSKSTALSKTIQERNSVLDKIEALRQNRFNQRSGIIQNLNSVLSPSIRLGITRNGQPSAFSAVLSDLLRGSGVKYGDIAPVLASAMSPRTLLDAVDSFDLELLTSSSGITVERASKVLAHLRSVDVASLIAVDVEDEISMHLLDGFDYKNISELSTGQRCTVILPIVLAHSERVVVVDQPEDHIDNAFITGTLIKAVLSRELSSQIIFSTHNPNIPVLGNAENVVQLASDGRRGYIDACGNLFEASVVSAISNVMEGGSAAFERRAKFYDENLVG